MTVVTRQQEDHNIDIDEEQMLYVTETLSKDCLNKTHALELLFYFLIEVFLTHIQKSHLIRT